MAVALMSLSGHFHLASGGFLAAPSLISNCWNLPFETQGEVMEAVPYKQENGRQKVFCVPDSHGILLGFSVMVLGGGALWEISRVG